MTTEAERQDLLRIADEFIECATPATVGEHYYELLRVMRYAKAQLSMTQETGQRAEIRDALVKLIDGHTDHQLWDEESLADAILSAYPILAQSQEPSSGEKEQDETP